MTRGDTFALGIIIALFSVYAVSNRLKKSLYRRRWANAKRAEIKAARLLHQAGFHIIRRQPTAKSLLYVDGTPKTTTIRADFLARRGFFTYVVEVKSGRSASQLRAKTRRQLLEYQLAFRPHGIVFVDMAQERHREIVFGPRITFSSILPLSLYFIVALLLGGAAGYFWGKGTWL
ncbi:MAG: hypothetical protein GX062_05055 [Firmicutes bacterium]|nr:hypothetical protein [Bacillota bacterium]